MLSVLVLAVAGAYAAIVACFAGGAASLRRASAAEKHLPDDRLPRAVVVVAARDEAEHLPRCIEALLSQSYPGERLLIVIVDDHSRDATPEVVASYARRFELALAHAGFGADAPTGPELAGDPAGDGLPAAPAGPRVVGIRAPSSGPLRGKAAALHAGITGADAFGPEVVLFTDADCAPPPNWARAMASLLCQPGVGLACGRTEVDAPTERGAPLLPAAEALDWTYLLTAAAVLTERVTPATGMGNNMGVRREVYDEIGGYHGVRFSVTEDHALFHAVSTRTRWRARFPLESALAVKTLALPSLGAVYAQRRRWARGGLLAGPVLFVLYALVYFGHLAALAAVALAVAGSLAPPLAAGVVTSKLAADYLLFRGALPPERRGLLRGFLAAQGLIFLYFTTVPLTLVAAPHISWKGRSH